MIKLKLALKKLNVVIQQVVTYDNFILLLQQLL